MYKAPKLETQPPPPDKSPLQIQAPGGLYLEVALKFKITQSKNCTIKPKFLHCQRINLCQMTAVKTCHSILLFA